MKREKQLKHLERELERMIDGFRVLAREVELDEGLEADILARDADGSLLVVTLLPDHDAQAARAMLTVAAADDYARRLGRLLDPELDGELGEEELELDTRAPHVFLVARRLLFRTVTSLERVGLPAELFELKRLREGESRRSLLVPVASIGSPTPASTTDESAPLGELEPEAFEQALSAALFHEDEGDEEDDGDLDEEFEPSAGPYGGDSELELVPFAVEDPRDGLDLADEGLEPDDPPFEDSMDPEAFDAETRVRMELLLERLRRIDEGIEVLESPRGFSARFDGAPIFTLAAREEGLSGRTSGGEWLALGAPEARDEFVDLVVERVLGGPQVPGAASTGPHPDDDWGEDDDGWDEGDERGGPLLSHPILTPEELEAFRD